MKGKDEAARKEGAAPDSDPSNIALKTICIATCKAN